MADDITGASAHDFTFISIDGQTLALSSYAGKAVFFSKHRLKMWVH